MASVEDKRAHEGYADSSAVGQEYGSRGGGRGIGRDFAGEVSSYRTRVLLSLLGLVQSVLLCFNGEDERRL